MSSLFLYFATMTLLGFIGGRAVAMSDWLAFVIIVLAIVCVIADKVVSGNLLGG